MSSGCRARAGSMVRLAREGSCVGGQGETGCKEQTPGWERYKWVMTDLGNGKPQQAGSRRTGGGLAIKTLGLRIQNRTLAVWRLGTGREGRQGEAGGAACPSVQLSWLCQSWGSSPAPGTH